MMMANLETFVMSPNRPTPVVTQTADELVKNYVSKLPEMNVTFGSNTDDGENGMTVNFSTSENAKLDQHGALVSYYTNEFAGLVRRLTEVLAANGHAGVKFEELAVDVTPGMYRSGGSGQANRQAVFTIMGTYKMYKN